MNQQPNPASFLKDVIARFGGDSVSVERKRPPVHLWNPEFCGNIDMRIARDGRWYYMGTPIDRIPMVKLFAGILRREPDDAYVLVTPVEKVGIRVDDVPFLAVEMQFEGEGRQRRIAFRTNLDEIVPLDAEHPLRVDVAPETGEPSPYINVRDRLEARLARPVYYQMAELAEPADDDPSLLGVWSAGGFHALGKVDVD
ncbi:DUF1285 domain-containing protein [Ferrovibrio sp.]|uniref:DUF1285 domain-containing protein n=1 Tax=Ferrovibrio sp. TaxID=1917215 RepID=UPI0025B94901|nr:DUF1285 domain-containing protein [Ferrovibrio sp.]MBX3455685.1 DUF1285 domain-containing protein [Ferrovibrio sp.]